MPFVAHTNPTTSQLNAANTKITKGGSGPTGTFAGSLTAVALTGTGVTVTVPTGGTVELTVVVQDWSFATTGYGIAVVRVRRDTTNFPGNGECYLADFSTNRQTTQITTVDTPAAGSHTYDLDRRSTSGGGTYTLNVGAYLIVKVYGPA